jgi:hypothetical protein
MMRLFVALATACAQAAAAESGIRPRPELSDYAVQETGSGVTIAADRLTASQVSNTFATDLNKGWIVVEVAVYPQKGPVDLDHGDFVLRLAQEDRKTLVRAASPKSIAGILQRKQAPPSESDITLHPTVGVGYESGPGYYDPVYGRRGGGGVRTSVGLGVGIGQAGSPPPASTPADRSTMELELTEKSLPEGAAAKPVAGYLYFPRPEGKLPKGTMELQYLGAGATVKLTLPALEERKR